MERKAGVCISANQENDSFLADEEHKIMMTFEDGRTDFLLSLLFAVVFTLSLSGPTARFVFMCLLYVIIFVVVSSHISHLSILEFLPSS